MSARFVVFITGGSTQEGERIARALVEERLAACVNIISPIHSIYRWQGQIHEDQEVLLVAKTSSATLEQLMMRAKQLHSYQVPEIIAVPIVAGAESYLQWIDEQTHAPAGAASTIP